MQRRRRSKRIWYMVLGVFVAVFLFSFLTQRFKNNSEVDAASIAGFDPGYIISDYQMSNYNSMSEADIQAFLTRKNPCNNKDYGLYQSMTSSYPSIKWHWDNGHFVCISEERFGDGETIGAGDTAAHIIWQTAQDYRINPQVLIVLLQKEQGLITDDFPNSRQYRSATGYGCPDTAPCASQYYGFKNQVRKAAALFRTVLDGGWTNYPLGNNYIQYNPNSACGGSVVNIRSLATSALYRYTPYQPNAGALAAGYGTAYCGAYGNRNFYLYFEDWFGGIKNTQRSTKIPNGLYYIQAATTKNLVVDVDGGNSEDGTNIQLYDLNKTDAQKWKISYNSSTDDYTIINYLSGKALDVDGASITDGANVQLWESNKSCAQRWKIVRTEKDNFKILSACSFKALDINGGSLVTGNNIDIWTANNTKAQKWSFDPVDELEDGVYTITSSLNNNRSVDISGGSHNAVNGSNAQIWVKNNTAAQRWLFHREKDGYYTIKNLQSKKAIDVDAGGDLNGTNVHVWKYNNTCAQKWKVLKNNDKYTIISACSYKVLDLPAANQKSGTNIQIYEANNTKAQQWELNSVQIIKDGEYKITSSLSDNIVMDIEGNYKGDGANIQIYEANNTKAQLWDIKYNTDDDSYSIYNKGANKNLDVQAAGRVLRTNIQTWAPNNTCAQKWVISSVGNEEYVFYSMCSSLVLDVDGGKKDNGTNVQLYDYNGTKAQKWSLK